jgi:hypothetical protein
VCRIRRWRLFELGEHLLDVLQLSIESSRPASVAEHRVAEGIQCIVQRIPRMRGIRSFFALLALQIVVYLLEQRAAVLEVFR